MYVAHVGHCDVVDPGSPAKSARALLAWAGASRRCAIVIRASAPEPPPIRRSASS